MDAVSVIQTLRAHEPELKAAGVLHLRLFGSIARGQANAESDVDLVAEFDRSRRLTLLQMVSIENRLTDLLGVRVDLAPLHAMKDKVRQRALHDAIHAF